MNEQVLADPVLQAKLAAANGHTVKLCDENGNTIGVALTLEQARRAVIELLEEQVPKEELDRRAAGTTWYTMDDVFRLLEES